ncbi:MAG: thiamine pyrophosphate-dependent enzyme, partial [Acidimicrobiia bacterium]|nr:thiamine pyrophosphate-dependent enzyme [Acidimicrobiia bacterium]
AGPTDDPRFAVAVANLGMAGGIPIIADPLSGLRAGSHDQRAVIASGDWLARRGDLNGPLRPGVVLRLGATPTSQSLRSWLTANRDIEQIVVDDAGWRDPGASASVVVRADAAATAHLLSEELEADDPDWLERWSEADRQIEAVLDTPFPSEPAMAGELQKHLPDGALLYTASSMPVRILDAYFRPTGRDLRILGNRGANGIDGLISSALGAAVGTTRPTFVFAGDLSLLHDLTALVTAVRLSIPVTVVLSNNDGGGIFHLLPQADFTEHFERHLGTPHGLDFARIAAAFGIEHTNAESAEDLGRLVSTPATGPRIIEVHTDRTKGADLLRSMWDRVADLTEA